MLPRLTGTYLGFEALRKELEPLTGPPSAVQAINDKLEAVMFAAKKDTCDLHYLIQEIVKIYRVAKNENNVALSSLITTILMNMGIEITDEGWGFKGEHPEPLQLTAKLVMFK